MLNQLAEFLLQLLSQFAGGPGRPENNLVRFGLAAVFWAVLLVVAVGRQRGEPRPRERLLVAGFGLAFFRDAYMFSRQAVQIIRGVEHDVFCSVTAPLEHTLTTVAMVLIAGSFIRYLLDDERVARAYLQVGLGLAVAAGALTFLWWPAQMAADPALHFNETGPAWALHLLAAGLVVAALALLARPGGWLRNVVVVALLFFALAEGLAVVNVLTGRVHSAVICPIANSLYLWAIPLFGYVYFHEQSLEKRRAEHALVAYRDHLAELVDERTAELRRAQARMARAAALEERQHIAADIHDGLAQTLSYLGLAVEEADGRLAAGDAAGARADLGRARVAVDQAVAETRHSIASLRADPERVALAAAVRAVVDAANGLAAVLESDLPDGESVAGETWEHARHVLEEALANARRHGGATRATVRVGCAGGEYYLEVADNGRGFDPDQVADSEGEHFGLSIMRARAARLGGSLAVASAPGQGTRVALRWPATGQGGRGDERDPGAVGG